VAIRIRGGRIICRACRRSVGEVVLLEPGRPLCTQCLEEQLGGAARTSSNAGCEAPKAES